MIDERARGGVAVRNPQLAAGAVAIGVDRRLRHAELSRDLLGAQVPIDKPQTLALSGGQKLDRVHAAVCRCAHRMNRLATRVGQRLVAMLRPHF